MTDLLVIGVTNLLMAAILAVIAFVVGRWSRNPTLAHALWLLVLIKLITPPLIRVPLPVEFAEVEAVPETVKANVVETETVPGGPIELEAPLGPPMEEGAAIVNDVPNEVVEEREHPRNGTTRAVVVPLIPEAKQIPETATAFPWLETASLLWLGGAGVLFWLTARRIQQFRTFLRHALPADSELSQCAGAVAAKLGVRSPSIWLMPGIVSPMLWSFGASRRLLLPADLLKRLSQDQQRTLLAHELAHLRRGDHWVRYLELIVLCLYWWCPLVWWARRELHAAEEECCDAWVVWALPHLSRDYALALVETLDFLCEVKPAAPLLASGIRPVPLLRRRLTMIMRGSSPRVLTAVGGFTLLVLAAVLLPLLPSLAQDKDRKEPPPPRKEKDFPPPPPGAGPQVQRLHEQLEQIHKQRKELDRQLAELHQLLEKSRPRPDDKERPERPEGKPEPKPKPRPDGEGPGARPFPPDRKPGEGPGAWPPGHGPVDRRLDELERKMDRMMEMMQRFGRDFDNRPFPPRSDGPKGPPPGGKDRDDKRPSPPEERRDDERPERPEFRRPFDPRPETPDRKPRPE